MSRALRNRCIEIFMDAPDCARRPPAGIEEGPEGPAEECAALDFLPEVPRRLARLLGNGGSRPLGAALRWAARRLDADLEGAGADALPVPPPAFLLDAARVLSCQLALRPVLALQVSLLHVAAQAVWRYLQGAALSEAAGGAAGQADPEAEAGAAWARGVAAAAGFTWRALLKCARLFAAAASRGAHGPLAEADERGLLERAFVQTYVAEVDGGCAEEALFSALFEACIGVESMPSFRWLAEASLRRPESLHTGPAPPAEAEVARHSGPLLACVAQGAGQWETLVQLRLFLERSSPADAPLRLRRVERLGEPLRAAAGGCRALLEHGLTRTAIPGAVDHVRGLLGARALGDSPRHSCQDGWALVDCAGSGGAAGSPALAAGAAHLRELLRCARALAVHLLAPPAPASAGGDAWSLSCRFQEPTKQ
ncbi:unnamed protein product [Prorocentrum cordatum]|uniref:Uncharacterized protein n=1 Tax=Prorocentrum cordatum TaxID=2364126 RepID=A0ABN9Q644_9DINO|nr:unnamed protein product [Polarella glacialis]